MSRARIRAACLALLTFGCAESHSVEDATLGSDAGARVDASDDSSPPCPDADGDGDSDTRCGGTDCDDSDATLSGSLARCVSADVILTCTDGRRVESPCAAATPLCHAMRATCVALGAACGDGVRHSGEECDDGNAESGDGCAACISEPCTASSQCPPDRPWCSWFQADGSFRCQVGNPVGALRGADCASDRECETGWCDIVQGRCSAACDSYDDCGTRLSYCDLAARQHHCLFACRAGGCVGGRGCEPEARRDTTIQYCQPSTGTIPDGDYRCRTHFECESQACALSAGGCSTLCEADAECSDPNRPFCIDAWQERTPDRPHWWAPELRARLGVCGDGPPRADTSCPDNDGTDGAAAWCGGTDCRQSGRPPFVGARGCVDPTTSDACTSTSETSGPVPCPPEAPLCRYPEGTCVATNEACGDRVIHPGEHCDDGNEVRGDGCFECEAE